MHKIISLDGDWSFAYQPEVRKSDDKTQAFPEAPPSASFATTMPIPSYWDDHMDRVRMIPNWRLATFYSHANPISFPAGPGLGDAELPYLIGVGWYRRGFLAPAEWSDRTVTLHIGGVALEAWVWFNGQSIGHHVGHSTSFELSLEKHLKAGEENELLIAVANVRTDREGNAIRGYAGQSGGIYRSSSLRLGGRLTVRSLYLYSINQNHQLVWNLDLSGYAGGSPDAWEAEWQIRLSNTNEILGEGVCKGQGIQGQWTTETFGMETWSDRSPKLHEVTVRVKQGGTLQDECAQPFGLRRLERDGMLLRLNGTPIYLRGTTENNYFPLTCTAPTSVLTYRDQLRAFRSVGFNWLRFHTWVPNEEYMQAADELGFLIQVEPPFGAGESEWLDILRACRRHPSVVIYCGGNEQLLDEANIERLKSMQVLLRKHVPDALFTPMEALRGVEYYFEMANLGADPVLWPGAPNQWVNIRRLRLLQEFSDVLETLFYNMEYGWDRSTIAWLNLTDSSKGNWRGLGELWRWMKDDHPHLLHELCILGTFLDLDLEHRYEGTRIGTDLYAATRKHLREEGVLPRANLCYRNSGAAVALWRKYHVELTRRCPQAQGYDFLGAKDCHWHRTGYPCGVLNEFLELKAGDSHENILRYNADSVLLLDHSVRRNFYSGDPFDLELLVSHYGSEPIAAPQITWDLRDAAGFIFQRANLTAADVSQGVVVSLGFIQFVLPSFEDARKVTLHVRLTGETVELENQWEFWVFPRRAPVTLSAAADSNSQSKLGERYATMPLRSEEKDQAVWIVSELDDKATEFLRQGGRVLLLWRGVDQGSEETQHSLRTMSAGRPFGICATIIADHPLFRHFPHEGYASWQFYSLLHDSPPVRFGETNLAFDPIMEAVGSYKHVRKKAWLFEYQIGAGRLLVCALTLRQDDPASAFLADELLTYAAGQEFNPSMSATVEDVQQLLNPAIKALPLFKDDRALDPNSLEELERQLKESATEKEL